MAVWKVQFFENHEDTEASRMGLIRAASEDEAASIAAEVMAKAEMRADLSRSVVPNEDNLPKGFTPYVVRV